MGQLNATDAGRDMNVERVWLQGVTGCDSVVAIVDDGKINMVLLHIHCVIYNECLLLF